MKVSFELFTKEQSTNEKHIFLDKIHEQQSIKKRFIDTSKKTILSFYFEF